MHSACAMLVMLYYIMKDFFMAKKKKEVCLTHERNPVTALHLMVQYGAKTVIYLPKMI